MRTIARIIEVSRYGLRTSHSSGMANSVRRDATGAGAFALAVPRYGRDLKRGRSWPEPRCGGLDADDRRQHRVLLRQLRARCIGGDPAAIHHQAAIGQLESKIDPLLDDQDCEFAAARDLPDRLGKLLDNDGSQTSVGSSISNSFGLPRSARAIDSICCSPPESRPLRLEARSASAGNSANSRSSVQRPGRRATDKFSRTVRLPNTSRSCGT